MRFGVTAAAFWPGLFLCVLLFVTQREVASAATISSPPALAQPTAADGGPTAAASLAGWLRQNGYPNLGTGNLQQVLAALSVDAGTNARTGTDINDLVRELNELIDVSPHAGLLRAFVPRIRFPLNDAEYFNNRDEVPFIALLQQSGGGFSHYVVGYSTTATSQTLQMNFMDPGDGALRTISMTRSGDRFTGVFNNGFGNRTVYIGALIDIERRVKTTVVLRGTDPVRIGVTPSFSADNRPQDFHVRVFDCDSTYTVTNLPAGWKYDVISRGNECYLSMWNDGVSTASMQSGHEFTIRYEGDQAAGIARRVANFTHSGSDDPDDNPEPKFDMYTILPNDVSTTPPAPLNPVITYGVSSGNARATYDWQQPPASPPQTVTGYELYNRNSGEFVKTATQSMFATDADTSNTIEAMEVAARYNTQMLSADTASGSAFYVNTANPAQVTPQQPNALFVLPFNDCPTTNGICGDSNVITVSFQALSASASLYLSSAIGDVAPAVPASLGVPHRRFYHIAAPGLPTQTETIVVVPIDTDELGDGDPRLLTLRNGQWVDITLGISQVTQRLIGTTTSLQNEIGMLVVVTVPRSPLHGWVIQ